MTNSKEITLNPILLNTTVITTLSVAIIYVTGYFYTYDYLANFGLVSKESDLIERIIN